MDDPLDALDPLDLLPSPPAMDREVPAQDHSHHMQHHGVLSPHLSTNVKNNRRDSKSKNKTISSSKRIQFAKRNNNNKTEQHRSKQYQMSRLTEQHTEANYVQGTWTHTDMAKTKQFETKQERV
ncbi:hypothetical protein FOCC_FOCC001400 [Frankliniella occidentalis]|nr:hypothetical protein FOCC_FOCC001400 [Frankliniella occidentalis]